MTGTIRSLIFASALTTLSITGALAAKTDVTLGIRLEPPGLDPTAAAPWAIGFVVLRVVHIALYLLDLDMLRSAVFGGTMICLVTMIVKAA